MQQKKETRRPLVEHWQIVKVMLVVYDVITIAAAYFTALLLRFDFHYSEIPYEYLSPYKKYIPFYIVICIITYAGMRLYRSICVYCSHADFLLFNGTNASVRIYNRYSLCI